MPHAAIAKRTFKCSERTVDRYRAEILTWGTVMNAEPLHRGVDHLITVEMGEVCRIRVEKDYFFREY
jgi:hypothetical protein